MEPEPVFDFGGALERMRNGHSVRRRGWSPDVFLAMVKGPDKLFMVLCDNNGPGEWRPVEAEIIATDWETVKPAPPAGAHPFTRIKEA